MNDVMTARSAAHVVNVKLLELDPEFEHRDKLNAGYSCYMPSGEHVIDKALVRDAGVRVRDGVCSCVAGVHVV